MYRYLCPSRKIGSVIGRGGEIGKQLRVDTKARIRIEEIIPGAEERVITIYSSSEETNAFDGSDDLVFPAQDALFKIHKRLVAEDSHGDEKEAQSVTARLLVPSDQIGCIIGKGGQIVQNIRSETGANIRILKDNHLPAWAIESDELVKISGESAAVKKVLSQTTSRLHDNPSRFQHILAITGSSVYHSSGSLLAPNTGASIVGVAPLLGSHGGYRDEIDWSHSLYSAPRNEMSSREFSVRLICPIDNIGGVIGKGGARINQIRHESGAFIKVDSSATNGNDCLIMISAKEAFEAVFSPTIEATVCLQPRCSEKIKRDSESGDLDSAKGALVQVTTRLRANVFDKEDAVSSLMPAIPYLSMPADVLGGLSHESRDSKRHARGHSYSTAYGNSSDLADDTHGVYSRSQIGGSGSIYGVYGSFYSRHGGSSGPSGQNSVYRRKSYGY